MLQFELLDETFDINKTNSLHLSIQVSLDGFLFSILEPYSLKYLGLKRYQFEQASTQDMLFEKVQEILTQDPLLQQSYQGVSCIQVDKRSTLLPAALFDKSQLKSYFEFNHLLDELDELRFNFLKQVDAYLVFPIHHEIVNLYLKSWVNAVFYHQATPFITEVIHTPLLAGKGAHVHFSTDHFDIVVTDERELLFHNNFSFRSDEDLLYFILFVFDKLGLDQGSTPLILSGDVDKLSERPSMLKRYFRNLKFRNAPAGFQYPHIFEPVQEHSCLSLFKVYHCA
jgi:hypothetical protein